MDKLSYENLKNGGFMKQIQKDKFSLRLRIVAGQIQANQLLKVSEIAEKYGHGYIHMTSRQSIEIPFIDLNDVNTVKEELKSVGLEPGACGPCIRTITACQGNAICGSGLIETTALAKELDNKYFSMELPHKFKIGITGCKNNCLKSEENDLGIKGGVKPYLNSDACTFCGVCTVVCPVNAITLNKETSKIIYDLNKCIYCGKCIKSCPMDAWYGEYGYILSVGGLFGNTIAFGKKILPLITNRDDLLKIIDTAINFFIDNANPGERFKFTLDRVGLDKLIILLEEVLK